MAQNIMQHKNNLPNKTLEHNIIVSNNNNKSADIRYPLSNSTITAVVTTNSSLPEFSPLMASLLPPRQPSDTQPKLQIINPTDDVILDNITNFSMNKVQNSDQNANICPPIPPNLGKLFHH